MEKMFTLKGSRLPAADVKNIIFFVRPRLELMDIIAENVLRYLPELLFGPKEVDPSQGFNTPNSSLQPPWLGSESEGGHLENWAGVKECKRGMGSSHELVQTVGEGGHHITPFSEHLKIWTYYRWEGP